MLDMTLHRDVTSAPFPPKQLPDSCREERRDNEAGVEGLTSREKAPCTVAWGQKSSWRGAMRHLDFDRHSDQLIKHGAYGSGNDRLERGKQDTGSTETRKSQSFNCWSTYVAKA